MPEGFFKILPAIASHPLALLAYLFLLVVWLRYFNRCAKSRDFLQALKASDDVF